MNAKTPILLLLLVSSWAAAQTPPSVPTVLLLPDGAEAWVTTNSSASADWYQPGVELSADWRSFTSGFGPAERHSEVSTVRSFSQIRIRQSFDVPHPPDSLTLSLKHEAEPLDIFLNGSSVLSLDAAGLPAADAAGFRHYDLSSHLGGLLTTGNLLALHVRGGIAIPVLHGTTNYTGISCIGIDPTATRLVEGAPPLRFRVFRTSAFQTRIHLAGLGGTGAALADFEIRRNGSPVNLVQNGLGDPYFDATFATGEASSVYEMTARDDQHAEAQEIVTLKPAASSHAIPVVVPTNDVFVSRTASSGEGSLRQAIENAERMPGLETIRFTNEEGVPFSFMPVTVALGNGSPGSNGLREGFTIEGPPSPGRVTIQGAGGPLFYISGANGAAARQDLTLRRLVLTGASVAVESLRYEGTMLLEDCEFVGNVRALTLYGRNSPPVVRRCLFTANTAICIGYTSGLPPVVENCTFTANGGTCLELRQPVLLRHCTFADNQFRDVSGNARFRNCLLAGETSDIKLVNSDFDQGGNLFAGVRHGSAPAKPTHPTSLATTASGARLGTPGFHGGFTRIVPILPDSPALDLGLSPDAGSPAFDQRGEPFLRRVGPSPDAGSYELQLNADDISIGIETEPAYDPITGLYFQFVVIHNSSPWTLSGFRLRAELLPSDAALYNGSGDGFVDVAGPIGPSEYRVVVLQYTAPRPDLRLMPILSVALLPDSDLPEPADEPLAEASLEMENGVRPCLRFHTIPGRHYQIEISEDLHLWRPCGAAVSAESRQTCWSDPDPAPPPTRYYRISRLPAH